MLPDFGPRAMIGVGVLVGVSPRSSGPGLLTQVQNLFGADEGYLYIDHPDFCYQSRTADPDADTPDGAADSPIGVSEDLSGNGHHLIAPTDAKRPTLRSVSGIVHRSQFGATAASALVSSTTFDLGAASTHVVALQKLSGGSIGRVIGDAGLAAKFQIKYDGSGFSFGVNNGTTDSGFLKATGNTSNAEIYTITRSQTADAAEIFRNGVSAVEADHDQASVTGVQPVAGAWGATGQFDNSNHYQFFRFAINRLLTAAEIDLVEALAAKYSGVSL